MFIGLASTTRSGYASLAVDDSNRAHIAFHQRQDPSFPYHAWRIYMPISGNSLHLDDELSNPPASGDVLWPQIAVSRNAGSDVIHEIAVDNTNAAGRRIYYWQNAGSTWRGPVVIDSTDVVGYVIAADGSRDRVAIVLHTNWEPQFGGLRNIAYYESQTEGLGWLDGSELGASYKHTITNYTDPDGLQAWAHISTAYDHAGTLQIVWDEQRVANKTADVAIRHWNTQRNTIRTVALGYWPSPCSCSNWNLNLAKITLGIGDGGTFCPGGAGSNLNDLYVLYTRFAGPTEAEQNDHSLLGYYNGELYLNVSNDGGMTWSPPSNLTNTKTPNCYPGLPDTLTGLPKYPDSVCRSENWATIGQDVSDIDIFYISDVEAGAWPAGESPMHINRAMYLRLPGHTTNAPSVCPTVAPYLVANLPADRECEYHTAPGTMKNDVTLTLYNAGNALLEGTVTVLPGAPWLSLSAAGVYAVNAGGPELSMTVGMDATSLTEGVYTGTIRITHNDPSQPSPLDLPVQLFVANQFFCAQDEILRTSVASPGVMALEVESTGRYASQLAEGGLFRPMGGSSSLYDASLVIAHGSQGPDTVVYHHYAAGNDAGQHGFRALSVWATDTSAYGTGQGYASASCELATRDSAIGVLLDWIFPQSPDSADFVIAQYRVFNHTTAAIESLVVGEWIDFDILPATWLAPKQLLNDNQASFDSTWNLVYQYGHDSSGNNPPNPSFSPVKFSAGISYILGPGTLNLQKRPLRAHVRENVDDVGSGPVSGFMYRMLAGPNGYFVFTPPPHYDPDLYTIMTLDQGRHLGVGDMLRYVIALVSDTLSNPRTASPSDSTSLMRTVRKAWAWAGNHGFGCDCHCQDDPECDGRTDILDVIHTIDRAFRGASPRYDLTCLPHGQSVDGRTDLDCNGQTDVVDVVRMINVAFRGAAPDTQFCRLCGS